MDINVYSASRQDETVRETPAAVYVLTAGDIRRSRATSVPEVLRLVPGVQAARIDANKWAVSIRGFNSRTTNNLLVMVDGRSVYDPLFSGVLWEGRDVMLEDIDRIEVVRGPGGTLWGANAVNGVINIITKHARDTQGGLVVTGIGSEDRVYNAVRYGWETGPNQAARVYARYREHDSGFSPVRPAADESRMRRAGFRWDWDSGSADSVVVSGDVYRGDAGEFLVPAGTQDADHAGGNVLTRWVRRISAGSDVRVQFYYDRTRLDNINLGEHRDTYDLDVQHAFVVSPKQRVIWGGGYRATRDDITNGPALVVDPPRRTDRLAHLFAQDEIALVPQRLDLIVGAKVERNDYTATEWQPNARLVYMPDRRHTWWAAVSRAVRTPSRLEADLVVGGNRLGDGFGAERLTAYEAGHRWLPTPIWSLDTAVFHNVYRGLLTFEQNFAFQNHMRGNTSGVEVSSRWQPTPRLRLDAAYTYLQMNLETAPESIDVARPGTIEGSNPRHQLALRGGYDIAANVELDAIVRHVTELRALGVPAYTALDLALGWRPRRDLELALVGQNLLDDHHPEQGQFGAVPNAIGTEVERGAYLRLSWIF